MARQTVVKFLDDVDGTELDEAVTVTFGVDGREYEFDTSPTDAEQFRAGLVKYLKASRRPETARVSKSSKRRPTAQSRAIRHWARGNGYEIGGRGRIPDEVMRAFEAVHKHAHAKALAAKRT